MHRFHQCDLHPVSLELWNVLGFTYPQMALTAEMRTEGGWVSCRPLTVACRNCWMSSGDMATVKRLAAHRARPRRNGDTETQQEPPELSEALP